MTDKFNWLAFGALFGTFWTCDAYKILAVFPINSRSHGILSDAVVKYLLEAGHEVTYITPFPKNDSSNNLRYVDVSANAIFFNGSTVNLKGIMDKTLDFRNMQMTQSLWTELGVATLMNENVQKLLKDQSQQFDLVLAEWLFIETYAVFPAVYDCPLIWFSTLEPHWMILSLIDETLNPAYNTGHLSAYALPFTFSQRITELWSQIKLWYYRNIRFLNRQEKVYETYIVPILRARNKTIPSFEDLRYNASLVLGNSHASLGQATRLPQNYKAIGGYHVESANKIVPDKDLQRIMDNAKNGIIYFSMGSNLMSKNLPDRLKRNLLKVFGELKQTVLWKFEEKLPNLPDNVHILDWVPQQAVLSHPNCILFITHGGLLSITEATHYGVPIIGIPVFADQFKNVETAVLKGFGIKVGLSYAMADDLKAAILTVTSDSSYRRKIKELSSIYHDRLVTPGRELVYWVEHVVRTQGAPHLRSPALRVPWYQKIYLDLFAVILMLVLISNIILRRLNYIVLIEKRKNKFD